MSDRDWFDDFMDYKLSTSSEDDTPASSSGCFPWVMGAIIVLWIVSKLFA